MSGFVNYAVQKIRVSMDVLTARGMQTIEFEHVPERLDDPLAVAAIAANDDRIEALRRQLSADGGPISMGPI